jgi:predicted 3-demethylubiquinone-9 3-methyltransferase (glyoxalase superfamily)
MEKRRIAPFLTFNGCAEDAMQFYAANLPGANITKLVRYGKDHPYGGEGEENKILYGALSFMGQEIMFLDMDTAHPAPDFSWAMSVYVDCHDEAEFDAVFSGLSQGGIVMMGPEPVGNMRKCAWVTDNTTPQLKTASLCGLFFAILRFSSVKYRNGYSPSSCLVLRKKSPQILTCF